MRSQAAMSGEMAGSDDPRFEMDGQKLVAATVTVYRMTQGQRFPYQATARWSEYCPDNAPMWKRMPHTMLGKCAEALALRKAFPQQLAGLYSREEMDQADKGGYVVEATHAGVAQDKSTEAVTRRMDARGVVGQGTEPEPFTRPSGAAETVPPAPSDDGPDQQTDALYLERVEATPTKNKNVTKYTITLSDGNVVGTIKTQLAALCEQLVQEHCPVAIETKETRWGVDLVNVARLDDEFGMEVEPSAPLTEDDIPF
jgi:hypothetical protein